MPFSSGLRLQLETGVTLVFLAMLLRTQLGRSEDPGHHTRNPRTQFRLLLALFVLSTVGLAPFLLSVSPLLAVTLAAGLTLALLHPANALCLFVHLLFLRPWELADNPLLSALPRLLAAVCVVSWILHPETHRKPTPQAFRALAWLAAFSLWLLLSTFAAPDAAAAQAEWFADYFKSFVVFVLCLGLITDERSVSQLKGTVAVSVFGLVALGLLEFLQPSADARLAARFQSISTVLDPNDLAAVTVLALPFALDPVFRGAAGLGRRTLGLAAAACGLAAVWYSQSRGAFIALGAQVLGIHTFRSFRERWLGSALLLCLLGAGYAGIVKAGGRSQEDMETSSDSRIIYWKAAVNMAVRHPLLGVGYGQYPRNYESHSASEKYEWGSRTAHSSWLLALAESGFVGGFLFLAFFFSVWRSAWRRRGFRPDHLYALLGYGAAMSFLSHTYLLYPYLLAGLILASESAEEPGHER